MSRWAVISLRGQVSFKLLNFEVNNEDQIII